MKERPILFSGEMVRAILAGRKTQTRRVVRPQPTFGDVSGVFGAWLFKTKGNEWLIYPNAKEAVLRLCPYGAPGARLWVRETFQPFFAEGVDCWGTDWKTGKGYAVRYVATDGIEEYYDEANEKLTDACKPAIHMPRWASRITLEITGVRMQRLQDISDTDASAEGVTYDPDLQVYHVETAVPCNSARDAYACLWHKINGPGSWNANPWVWVVEFNAVKQQ